jgi:Skp family chaperone for outer membrane proteins
MTEDKREQLANSINDRKKRLQRDVQDADEEAQREQKAVFQPLEGKLNTVINQFAADNGYAVVIDVSVEGNQVRYAAPTVDITRDVVALFDKSYGNKP